MAFSAKDGTMHHSAGRAKLHDDMAAPAAKAAPMKKAGGGDGGMKHPAPSEQSIEEHVQEHGPAMKMEYHHDKGSGKHHVTSHHGGGAAHEQHHSIHDNAQDAHEHMGAALDVNPMNEEEGETESPDEAMGNKTGEGGGGGIPGLA